MNWRNQFLALFCLLAFVGLGILYFQHWVVQKPFAIVLFIGEGLTPRQIAATRLYVGGADARLALDAMPHSALLMNASTDFAVPDQAAAATAIATGVKVNNRLLAIDAAARPLPTLLESAHARGRATALVTNTKLTDPTCAAFYAHQADPTNAEKIARDFVDGQNIDIALGGGASQFLAVAKGGTRQDALDLVLASRGVGYEIVRTRAELEAIPVWRRSRVLGLFAPDELAFRDQLEARKDQPSLSEMVRRAIELLQYNARGYLLVVDAGLMRKAAQANQGERTLAETAELDRALAIARRYAGERSTIIVCGDVAIGGMSINGFPFHKDSGLALLGLNPSGQPWITWATGPNGLHNYGAAKLANREDHTASQSHSNSSESNEPALIYAKQALNTVEDVVALGVGPGSDGLRNTVENTFVFKLLHNQL